MKINNIIAMMFLLSLTSQVAMATSTADTCICYNTNGNLDCQSGDSQISCVPGYSSGKACAPGGNIGNCSNVVYPAAVPFG